MPVCWKNPVPDSACPVPDLHCLEFCPVPDYRCLGPAPETRVPRAGKNGNLESVKCPVFRSGIKPKTAKNRSRRRDLAWGSIPPPSPQGGRPRGSGCCVPSALWPPSRPHTRRRRRRLRVARPFCVRRQTRKPRSEAGRKTRLAELRKRRARYWARY